MQQVFQAFFLGNLTQLSELIRTGKMDFMLLLPLNTRFLVSLRQVDLGAFINGAAAIGVMGYALKQMGVVPGLGQVAGVAVLVVCGVLIHYSLVILLASVSFWTIRAQGLIWGYYSLFNIARLPEVVFSGVFRAVFTFVVPMLLVANVPAKLLIGKLGAGAGILTVLLLTLGWLAVSEIGWRFALKHYASASS